LSTAAGAQDAGKPDLVITILHTNDLHSHDEPFLEHGKAVGGEARIAHLIRSIRRSAPHVLAVDAGDIFQGTPFFKFYHGAVEVALLNMLGYDIYTIGNHEFDDGPENLAAQLKAAKFDIICSNLDASAVPALAEEVKPSVVKTIDSRKVGFVGVITPDLQEVCLTLGQVRIKDPGPNWMEPVKAAVARLQEQGVDKIILVTHTGVERDRELAEQIPQVDAIIGGHSHTRLEKPIVVRHEDGTATVIVQTGAYGRNLGELRLAFDGRGRVILPATDYHLFHIDTSIPQEPDVQAFLREKGKPIAALRNQVLATALNYIDGRSAFYPWDSPIGDLICDALAERGAAYGATIAFQNRGGMRGGLEKGLVTSESVEGILPFDNKLVLATVTGKTIKSVLEHSVSGGSGGRFLDVHGLKFAYDVSRPPGSRILFVQAVDNHGRWQPLDPDRQYKIAVNDYTFHGGEGYDFSGATDIQPTQERLAAVLSAYLIRHKTILPQPPSRIAAVSGQVLSLVSHRGKQILELRGAAPHSTLTLVAGSGQGVDWIAGSAPVPVPLSEPRILVSGAVADDAGEYFWQMPLEVPGDRSRAGSENERGQKSWLAVVIHPPKAALANTTVSSPLQYRAQ